MKISTYDEFINNIITTRGRHGCGDGYSETHHIIPISVGGTNDPDNLVDLFAREHFEAHRLLALENPDSESLIYAWHMMCCMNNAHGRQYVISADEYEESRVAYTNMLQETFKGENNPFYGRKHTEESLEKMSKSSTGKKHTRESKDKMSESRMGDKNYFYGKRHTNESKSKMSESSRGSNNGRSRKVYCYELDKMFNSTREAEREIGVNYRSIAYCANKEQKFAGKHPITGEKLTWVYLDDEKIKNDIS